MTRDRVKGKTLIASELFFKDFGDRLREGPLGLDELNRLGEPHGIQFFDDWIAEQKAAYNLRGRLQPARHRRVISPTSEFPVSCRFARVG